MELEMVVRIRLGTFARLQVCIREHQVWQMKSLDGCSQPAGYTTFLDFPYAYHVGTCGRHQAVQRVRRDNGDLGAWRPSTVPATYLAESESNGIGLDKLHQTFQAENCSS